MHATRARWRSSPAPVARSSFQARKRGPRVQASDARPGRRAGVERDAALASANRVTEQRGRADPDLRQRGRVRRGARICGSHGTGYLREPPLPRVSRMWAPAAASTALESQREIWYGAPACGPPVLSAPRCGGPYVDQPLRRRRRRHHRPRRCELASVARVTVSTRSPLRCRSAARARPARVAHVLLARYRPDRCWLRGLTTPALGGGRCRPVLAMAVPAHQSGSAPALQGSRPLVRRRTKVQPRPAPE